MSKYYDLDKLKGLIEAKAETLIGDGAIAFYAVAKWLDFLPAADVAPVIHAHNAGTDYAACDQFVCSKCGIELRDWVRVERDQDDGEEYHYEYRFKRCPECGAKMDEEVK